jgi:hypothetical protein
MMKHAAAVDVIKLTQIRRIQQRAGDKADASQASRLCPRLSDAARGSAEVDIGNVARFA